FNFDEVFEETSEHFLKSDYVVGNLETICTGKTNKLTDHIYSFNSPKEFIKSVNKAGISMVTTATNHSLDRGIKGLLDNINVINENGLDYIGTYLDEKSSEEIFINEINGVKIAYLNYTFGTNAHINGVELTNDELHHIKLLKPQTTELKKYKLKMNSKKLKPFVARNLFKVISLKTWVSVKRKLGLTYNTPYQDNDLSEVDQEYLNRLKLEIQMAKEQADIVIMCMHSGGQFHPEPGKFSQYIMKFLDENGVDMVIGNHSHVVQRTESFDNGMIAAYCLGNFSISPSSVYVLDENLPDYSVLLHTYIDKSSKKITKITFSILKVEETKNGSLTVFPIQKLYNQVSIERKNEIQKNATKIFNRFTGNNVNLIDIKSEYALEY